MGNIISFVPRNAFHGEDWDEEEEAHWSARVTKAKRHAGERWSEMSIAEKHELVRRVHDE